MAVCSPSTLSDSVPCCSVWEPSFPSNAATRSTRGFRAEETASLMIELSRWPMQSCCFGPTTGWDVGIPTTWDLSRCTWHGLKTTWDGGLVMRRRLEEGCWKLVELFWLFVALLLQPSWRPEPEGFVEQPLSWTTCELSVELLVGSSLLSRTGHSLGLLVDTLSLSETEQSRGLSAEGLSDAVCRSNSRLTGLWGNSPLLSLMGPFSVVVTVDWSDAGWGLDWCALELLVDTSSLSRTEQSPGLSVDGLSGAGSRLNSRLTGLRDNAELFSGPRTEDLSGVATEDWSGVVTEDLSGVVTEVLSDAGWEPAWRSMQLWVGTLPFSRMEQSPGLVTEGLLDAGSGLNWKTMGLLDDISLLSVMGHPSRLAPEGSIEIGPGTRWCSTGLSLSPELPRVFSRVSTAGTCCGSGSQSSNGDGSSNSMTASYSVIYSSISSCRGMPGDGKTGSSAPRTIRSASSRASGTAPYILACASITRKRRLSSVLQAVQSASGPSRLMAHSLSPRQPFASSGLNNTEARCFPVRTCAWSLSMQSYRPSQRRQWYGACAVGRWQAMWCVFIVLNSEMKQHCVQLYRRPCLFWVPSVARNISLVIDLKGGRWHELVDYPGRKSGVVTEDNNKSLMS